MIKIAVVWLKYKLGLEKALTLVERPIGAWDSKDLQEHDMIKDGIDDSPKDLKGESPYIWFSFLHLFVFLAPHG